MENCSICNFDYKKAFKSNHLKSVKHLEKLNQYYCKKFNKFLAPQISQDTQNAFGITTSLASHGVEVIVNGKTYIKLRVNPTNDLEDHINVLLDKNYFR